MDIHCFVILNSGLYKALLLLVSLDIHKRINTNRLSAFKAERDADGAKWPPNAARYHRHWRSVETLSRVIDFPYEKLTMCVTWWKEAQLIDFNSLKAVTGSGWMIIIDDALLWWPACCTACGQSEWHVIGGAMTSRFSSDANNGPMCALYWYNSR